MIKKSFFRMLMLLDRILKCLIPVRERQICYSSLPDYSDNSFHLYKHVLSSRKNIVHVWLIRDVSLVDKIRRDFDSFTEGGGHTLKIVKHGSVQGYLSYIRSAFSFHTHGLYHFSNWHFRRVVVCLWHGMPIKAIGKLNTVTPNPKPTHGSHFIAASYFFKYVIAATFGADPSKVIVAPQPRCDALIDPKLRSYTGESIKSLLGLEPKQKLALWMPTYRAETNAPAALNSQKRTFLDDLPPGVLDGLIEQSRSMGLTVLVKLHAYDTASEQALAQLNLPFEVLSSAQWQETGLPLYELVAAADILLSDVSSVLLDFMIVKRPIGIVGYQPSTYTRDTLFPHDWIFACNNVVEVCADSDVVRLFEMPPTLLEDELGQVFNQAQVESGSETILQSVGVPSA